jgi:hypothetical protein
MIEFCLFLRDEMLAASVNPNARPAALANAYVASDRVTLGAKALSNPYVRPKWRGPVPTAAQTAFRRAHRLVDTLS